MSWLPITVHLPLRSFKYNLIPSSMNMTKKVLIVEDEPVIADDIERSLETMGYTVTNKVTSGREAISEAEKADLVLMDIFLAGEMDGIEAAKKIHSELGKPVVFLTAYADNNILERAKEARPYGYVVKPYDERGLRATIEMALYKHTEEENAMGEEEWIPEKAEPGVEYWIAPSEGYIIVEKEPEMSFKVFVDLVNRGIPGFVVSRVHPDKLKEKYGVKDVLSLWLSRSLIEDSVSPDNIFKLIYAVRDFTRRNEESVVLLDGVEYLVAEIGFEKTLMHLLELKDIAVTNRSRLIITLCRDTLPERAFHMLEKEFRVLG